MPDNTNQIIKSVNNDHISNRISFIRNLLKGKQLEPIVMIDFDHCNTEYIEQSRDEYDIRKVIYKKVLDFNKIINEIGGKLEYIKSADLVLVDFFDNFLDFNFLPIGFFNLESSSLILTAALLSVSLSFLETSIILVDNFFESFIYSFSSSSSSSLSESLSLFSTPNLSIVLPIASVDIIRVF